MEQKGGARPSIETYFETVGKLGSAFSSHCPTKRLSPRQSLSCQMYVTRLWTKLTSLGLGSWLEGGPRIL